MPNYSSLSHPANKAINFSLREQAAYSEALLRGIAGFQIYGVLVPMLMAGRIQPGDVMLSWMRAAKTKRPCMERFPIGQSWTLFSFVGSLREVACHVHFYRVPT